MSTPHDVVNALVTLAAARHVGVVPSMGIAAWRGPVRRLQCRGTCPESLRQRPGRLLGQARFKRSPSSSEGHTMVSCGQS